MKLHLDNTGDIYFIHSFDGTVLKVQSKSGVQTYENSLVLLPDQIITNWPVSTVEELGIENLKIITELNPSVVVLGTGESLLFPKVGQTACLINLNIGLEVMNNSAACRTYNILASEGRNVALALIL